MRIYKRSLTSPLPELFDFPSSFSRTKTVILEKQVPDRSALNIQTIADQLLLQHFSPSGVLVNENGDIIYIHGHTGKYLEPAVGKANLNIFAMLREGLRKEFPHAFRQAIMKKEVVVLRNIKIGTNGSTQTVNVNIEWIDKPELLNGSVMIIFTDVTEIADVHLPPKLSKKAIDNIRKTELENELQRTREEIQNTLEEVQTSQEELKSTNEELQSTNEELQSTNEELTTSKEEMQSLNEELQTVNAELQAKVDDYSRVNNDMKNLLNSTEIATLFLDKELNIRRFTLQATKIFKLIKSDIGRPFTDQVSDLVYPGLVTDALEVLNTLIFVQKEIPARDGRWFSVRIMPYRTFDDRIDGLVITFINISDHKDIETKLFETERTNRILLSLSSDIMIILSVEFIILEFNTEAEKFFGKIRKDCINKNFLQMFIPETAQKKTEKNFRKLLKDGLNSKIQLSVINASANMSADEWSVNITLNEMNTAEGIILSIKK
jgi:two-component system CheB/CheR fusion protein